MAETGISAGNNRHTKKAHGAKRGSTKVDLTPMVDLGFLLITFFIITTTWSTPKTLPIRLPANGTNSKIGENAVLTIIAAKGDKVFYYFGNLDEALREGSYGTAGYSLQNGIGDIIRQKQRLMDDSHRGGRKELMILIKASEEANLKNIVALLDETIINMVPKYALVEIGKEEKQALVQKKLS